MRRLIECGECTVQKLGRISIAGVMKKHGIEPGDTVVVDLRVSMSDDVLDEDLIKELNSTRYYGMSLLSSVNSIIDTVEIIKSGELSEKERDELVVDINRHLEQVQRGVKLHFDISDKEYKKFQKRY